MKRSVRMHGNVLGFASRANCGQALVEFAMILPLFLVLIFGMIDIGRVIFVEVTLQNAMRQAGRFAVTGNHLPDRNNPGQNLTRVASINQIAQSAAVGLHISSVQITSRLGGVTTSGSAGGPGATVTISLTTDLQLITPLIGHFFGPNGIYTFTVSTTFRNEPFPPGQAS